MIKFFQKIRFNQIKTNNTSKYIKYALGEIILVMIGILLALQVNNWNEHRKDKIEEKEILREIVNSLQNDLETQLFPLIEDRIIRDSAFSVLVHYIDAKLPYSTSLDTINSVLSLGVSFKPQITIYKGLEERGIKIIGNEKIKHQILQIYNEEYPSIQYNIENFLMNIRDYGRPLMRTEFITMNIDEHIYRPINYENLSQEPIYRNTLLVLKSNNKRLLINLESAVEKVEDLIKNIDLKL